MDLPERPKRKPVPLAIRLEVALRQLATFLGCDPSELELEHTTALELRPVENGVHVPHQHDPAYLEYMAKAPHSLKTNGRRGTSDLSLDSNSDKARIAKVKRLEEARLAEETFRRRLLATDDIVAAEREKQTRARPKAKIPSRPFPKGRSFPKRQKRG